MSHSAAPTSLKSQLLLSLGALGVVYGDIGTSPLYAVKEIFFGHHHLERSWENSVGVTSLVIWALTLIVTFKYVVFVLRADNHGEGGVFALYSLLQQKSGKMFWYVGLALILASGLLFGDGVITPAISVISAVEGLSVATSAFQPYVVPITVVILTCLFLTQRFGTAKIGQVFGPIIAVWFVVIGALGLNQLLDQPAILTAINPLYAWHFLTGHPLLTILTVLGSVILVVTGGEAMYADMGHFGRLPIRISWFALTYPALLLNYFGQGAYLLSGKTIVAENIFYSMAPSWALYPLIGLATMATIIASQALITGAFSLAAQAVNLHLIPYLKTKHTHHHHEGQIYIPFINKALFVGCISLVFAFQSSSNLASAYGLAVAGDMVITSVAMILVAYKVWKWYLWQALGLFVPLALLDLTFLGANSLKIFKGGYIPLLIGLSVLGVMKSWNWGRRHVAYAYSLISNTTIAELINKKRRQTNMIDRVMVILSPTFVTNTSRRVPFLQQLLSNKYGQLAKDIIYLTVKIHNFAEITNPLERYSTHNHYLSKVHGSITSVQINFGFMEEPNIESVLDALVARQELPVESDPQTWIYYAAHERIFFGNQKTNLVRKIQFKVYNFLLKNAPTADQYFGIGKQVPLSIELIKVQIKAARN